MRSMNSQKSRARSSISDAARSARSSSASDSEEVSARVSRCRRTRAVCLHQQPGAAARNVRDNGGAAMELGDGAEIDREREFDLLSLAQTQIRGFDEDAGGTEIHRATQLASAARDIDVDGSSGAVPGVQSAFHGSGPRYISVSSGINARNYAFVPAGSRRNSTYRGGATRVRNRATAGRPRQATRPSREPAGRNLLHLQADGHGAVIREPG